MTVFIVFSYHDYVATFATEELAQAFVAESHPGDDMNILPAPVRTTYYREVPT